MAKGPGLLAARQRDSLQALVELVVESQCLQTARRRDTLQALVGTVDKANVRRNVSVTPRKLRLNL